MKALLKDSASAWTEKLVGICMTCLVLGAWGCATTADSTKAPEVDREAFVLKRAQARWDALLANRMAEAYKFYSAASRAVMSYEDFIRSVKLGFWKSAQVEKVNCEAEDACEALVTIEYAYRGNQIKTPIREIWIRAEGNWWYVQKG